MKELADGARPLIDEGRTDLELVIEEIIQDKIAPTWPSPKRRRGRRSVLEHRFVPLELLEGERTHAGSYRRDR